ncbi:MAG: TolC family outer membrane protein [Halieaceae bacterium]|jgi:adhesin transport system outer membrane protein|nr:TolC family outer membrane protein [Halieaceae bacterium]
MTSSKRTALSKVISSALAILASSASMAQEQAVTNYGQAVAVALSYNPAVVSAYHEFEAARQGQSVAEGGLYPSVDLGADYAWEERSTPLNDFGDYDRDSVNFSVTQLLFDGFATRDQARAAGYDALSAYYAFDAASQAVALDATEVYLNTLLYQRLVAYAEENYVVHRQLFNRIAERAEGGVSQRVDLEQATARMALAESNLLTEVTNLHDTRAEFQRVVGHLPGESLSLPMLPPGALPEMRDEALAIAYQQSPEINVSIEDLRAAKERQNATRGPFYPRFDLRYRNENANNLDGFRGDYDLEAIEIVMTYNLYRGGADSARRREASHRYYAAVEARKQACLDVRRETMIAFNDIGVLERQVEYLDRQLAAQDKTRRAYNDQFDLGQRSLLDLLDSQNEYFDTQRALITARTQLVAAQAKTLAQMGALTQTLDAQGFNADRIASLELELMRDVDENIPACPSTVPGALEIDQEAIFERLNSRADSLMD